MAQLPRRVKQRHVKYLVLPGNHDSGSNQITEYGMQITPRTFAHGYFAVVQDFALDPVTAPIIMPIIRNVSVNHPQPFTQQLQMGVRAFDLRVSYANITAVGSGDDPRYLSHTYMTQPLLPALQQFAAFLEANPGEILYISAEYDWEHRVETSARLEFFFDAIMGTIGKYFNPGCRNFDDKITLESMIESGQRIFFFWGEDYSPTKYPTICSARRFKNYWPNSDNTTIIMQNIEQHVARTNFSDPREIFGISAINTARVLDILRLAVENVFIKNITVEGLLKWSEELRKPTDEFLDSFFKTQTGLSAVFVDWTTPEFVTRMIGYNLL